MAAFGADVVYERADAIGFGQRNRQHDDGHSYISVCESAQATADTRRHWCFRAPSTEVVRAFHRAGMAAGGEDEGAPGFRDYHPGYYAAFLRDPEGNKLEGVLHHATSPSELT